MSFAPSGQDRGAQVAHLRHELLTHVNHVLGFTEMQLEEEAESRLRDYRPAMAEIHAGGRNLLAIIERELEGGGVSADLVELDRRLTAEARPALYQVRSLAGQLRDAGLDSAAEEMDLVSGALQGLIATSHQMAQI